MVRASQECPACNSAGMLVFYEVQQVPVNSVLLVKSRQEALNFRTGEIALAVCPACSFISNLSFDESLTRYSAQYEATQGYSPTFNEFHRALAQDLIERFDLHDKDIIEIGCDKGDFITMLCEMGNNRGVGFDPAYVPGRHPSPAAGQMSFVADFYSEKYAGYHADFICCKMTLEHIPAVGRFIDTIRRSIGDRLSTVVFFQVPNARYVLCDVAFWDIYYEHCSYFTKGALGRLFRKSGFEVKDLWTAYDDQYLMIEAVPVSTATVPGANAGEETPAETLRMVEFFVENYALRRAKWENELARMKAESRKVVLWGGGSKGVAFLTTLNQTLDDVAYAVDINPVKTGTFMAGTGQEIVSPSFLRDHQPDVVIIMNPVYRDEITRELSGMGLSPDIRTL